MMGDEADAMQEREMIDQGYEDAQNAMHYHQEKVACPHCGKRLRGKDGVYNHIKAKHNGKGKGAFREEREESFAERAIQAEIDIACGFRTDDDWLLP